MSHQGLSKMWGGGCGYCARLRALGALSGLRNGRGSGLWEVTISYRVGRAGMGNKNTIWKRFY